MTSLQKASLTEIRNTAARICRDYLNGKWKEVQPDELIVKRISGGLSNFLYYVALPEPKSEEPKILGLDNAVENTHSTSVDIDQDGYDDVDDLTGATTTAQNDRKRRRTESGSSTENFATFAFRRHVEQASEPKQVLLRIYGQSHGEDALEAMITESVVFALLSERNFGPKLHGIFPGGRIEQYIPARALTTLELSDERISKKIAEKLGEIHSLNIPMSKEPDWIWNCMDRWLKSVNSILKENKYKHREHAKTVLTFDFASEGQWLKSVIEAGKYPVAFCHNDMQEGNILFLEPVKHSSNFRLRDAVLSMTEEEAMEDCSFDSSESLKRKPTNFSINNNANSMNQSSYNIENEIDNTRDSAYSMTSGSYATVDEECCDLEREPNLMIIDFEYCAYNYRGFDLANHFLEWTFDYTNPEYPFYHHYKTHYPTEKQRKLFISSYLCKLNSSVPAYEPTMEEIENLQTEVRVLSMLSHLFWSLWSIVNLSSNIEFGYWEYAVCRIQEYRKLKQTYLNADSRSTEQGSAHSEFNMIE